MSVVFSNNAFTTLGAGINSSVTSFTVDNATSFPTISSPDYAYVTLISGTATEIIKVTDITGSTFTCLRGQESTIAAAFALGDSVELRITAALLTDVPEAATAVMDADFAANGRLVRTASGTYSTILDKLDATAPPDANEDTGDGYAPGSVWVDVTNDKAYVCIDATSTAAIWEQITGALFNVGDDTAPQLGGSLDVNSQSIVSIASGDIAITPDTTGDVIIDGLKYPQADGTVGQSLITNGSAQLSWDTISSGIGAFISTSIAISSDGSALAVDDETTNANIGIGLNAGNAIIWGANAIAIGTNSGLLNTASNTICLGNVAGAGITSGGSNIAVGVSSIGGGLTIGNGNIGIGSNAGYDLTSGNYNNFLGNEAGANTTTGSYNVAIGYRSMRTGITTGDDNTCIGQLAGEDLTSGNGNVFLGANCGYSVTTGINNIAIGKTALTANVTGTDNIALGRVAGWILTGGSHNVCLGALAGNAVTSGNNNILIGQSAGDAINFATGSNTIAIGYLANPTSTSISNEITLGNSSIATIRAQVSSITALSDERDKANIQDLTAGLGFINKLRPVSFNWDVRDQYFIEEEVDGKTVRTPTEPDGSKEGSTTVMGFLSQEVIAAKADETEVALDNLLLDLNPERLELKQGDILVPLVKAVQELSAQNAALVARIAVLEA